MKKFNQHINLFNAWTFVQAEGFLCNDYDGI